MGVLSVHSVFCIRCSAIVLPLTAVPFVDSLSFNFLSTNYTVGNGGTHSVIF